MNRILKNYILDATYEMIALLVPLLTAPYLTRVLHADNYGIYSYVQSVGGLIITFSLLGIYSYGNRQIAYCRDNPRELSRTFWEIMLLRVVLGIAGTCVYFGIGLNSKYAVCFTLYYAYYLANILDCSWVYVGMENMLPCVIKNTAAKLITLAGVFLLVKTENDVWKYVLLVSGGTLAANLSVYGQLRGIIQKPELCKDNIFKHLKGSAYLFLPQIAGFLYLQMDKIMLEQLTGGTAQVSFYDQAEKLVVIPLAIITALSTVMMPRIANDYQKGNVEQIEIHIGKAAQYSLFLALPLAAGITSIATRLIPWYLGADYMPTAYAMIIISPIVVSNTLLGITGKQYFTATNQIAVLTASNTTAAVINLFLNRLLIPLYGYIGAAAATLIASYTNAAIQMYCMNKAIRIYPIVKKTYRYLIGATITGIMVYICTKVFNLSPTPVTTIIQVCTGVISYFVFLSATHDETMSEIIQFMKKRR